MGNTSFPKGLATLTWLVKVRRGNPTVIDWGWPKNGQLWTKNGRLVQSIPKGTKTVYLSDFWPFGTLLGPSWRGWLSKLKICKEANHTLLLKRHQNNFFGCRLLHGANISLSSLASWEDWTSWFNWEGLTSSSGAPSILIDLFLLPVHVPDGVPDVA